MSGLDKLATGERSKLLYRIRKSLVVEIGFAALRSPATIAKIMMQVKLRALNAVLNALMSRTALIL